MLVAGLAEEGVGATSVAAPMMREASPARLRVHPLFPRARAETPS